MKNRNDHVMKVFLKMERKQAVFKYFDDTKAGTVIATRDFSKGDGSCYTTLF
jgi:hypothetical protein